MFIPRLWCRRLIARLDAVVFARITDWIIHGFTSCGLAWSGGPGRAACGSLFAVACGVTVSRNGDLARFCDITGSQVLVRLDGFMRQSMLETWWIPASSLSMTSVVAPYFVCHVRVLVVK